MNFGGDDFFGGPLTLGQFGFMAEAEGQDDLVDTREARFNAALREISHELDWAKSNDDIDTTGEINDILYQHGIDPNSLTPYEVAEIEAEVA